jgi:hypothetical protein
LTWQVKSLRVWRLALGQGVLLRTFALTLVAGACLAIPLFYRPAFAQEIVYVCRYDTHPVVFFGKTIMKPRGADTYKLLDDGVVQFGRHEMTGTIGEERIHLFGAFDQPNKKGLLLKLKHTVFIDRYSGRYNRFSQITNVDRVIFNEIVEGECKIT